MFRCCGDTEYVFWIAAERAARTCKIGSAIEEMVALLWPQLTNQHKGVLSFVAQVDVFLSPVVYQNYNTCISNRRFSFTFFVCDADQSTSNCPRFGMFLNVAFHSTFWFSSFILNDAAEASIRAKNLWQKWRNTSAAWHDMVSSLVSSEKKCEHVSSPEKEHIFWRPSIWLGRP